MFSLLHLLSYVGALGGFLFVTLSLASGLLWLAELIEEHSRYAKAIGMRGIYTIIALHVLLLFTDSLPPLSIFFSIACHLVYLSNFTSSWPYISLSSPRFILSCVLVIADHFTWFYHFANKASEAKRRPKYRYGAGYNGAQQGNVQEHSFMDVAAFFGICVWAVPLFLFLSLSANDNALPNIHSGPPSPAYANGVDLSTPLHHPSSSRFAAAASGAKSQTSLVRAVLEPILALLPRIKRRSKRERADEGLLAPRTPVRGSPLHTPVRMSSFSATGGGGSGGGYFPWSSDGERDQASASSSSSVYGASAGGGGASASARPRTPTSGSFSGASPDKAKSTMYGALALDLAADRDANANTGTGPSSSSRSASLSAPSHPPPRRVQSEAQVQGAGNARNPRGIATRNGKPALESAHVQEKSSQEGSGKADSSTAGAAGQKSNSPPRVSLGPAEGKRLDGVEILESQTLTKRKAD